MRIESFFFWSLERTLEELQLFGTSALAQLLLLDCDTPTKPSDWLFSLANHDARGKPEDTCGRPLWVFCDEHCFVQFVLPVTRNV